MRYNAYALDSLAVVAAPLIAAAENSSLSKPGPWRPPEWASPALTSITVPGAAADGSDTQIYVFDAVFKVEHTRELKRTEHPIQTSSSSPVASITDHAYRLPSRVVLDIGMSDAQDSYADVWTSDASKSVSAFQVLVNLQNARTLVTLTTRLATYSNMLVESVRPGDDVRTLHGLRASIVLTEIFLADATAVNAGLVNTSTDDTTQPDSANPQVTDQTPAGTVQGAALSTAQTAQHQVTGALLQNVPGAGAWSSVNISSLGNLV